MLKPLQQWICDSCGELIEQPEHGWVEWKATDHKKHGFRIVHHALHSPRREAGRNCYYSNDERAGDLHLTDLIGVDGLIILTSWLDVGEWHNEDYVEPRVSNLREWTTLFRRLHLPYYEEARNYTAELQEMRSGGANEIYLYLPDTLKRIIEEHEE